VLSRTVPSADAGIPKEAGLRPSGPVTPPVELFSFGLITNRPTGSNITRRTRRRAVRATMMSALRLHFRRGGFSADSIGPGSGCFSSEEGRLSDGRLSDGSVNGLIAEVGLGSIVG
jgi:hypothetical protein